MKFLSKDGQTFSYEDNHRHVDIFFYDDGGIGVMVTIKNCDWYSYKYHKQQSSYRLLTYEEVKSNVNVPIMRDKITQDAIMSCPS